MVSQRGPLKFIFRSTEGQTFYWSIMTVDDGIKCRCANSGMTTQVSGFAKSRGLSASVSFLSSPPPPRSFTYAIFERSLTIVPRSLLLNRTVKLATQASMSHKPLRLGFISCLQLTFHKMQFTGCLR